MLDLLSEECTNPVGTGTLPSAAEKCSAQGEVLSSKNTKQNRGIEPRKWLPWKIMRLRSVRSYLGPSYGSVCGTSGAAGASGPAQDPFPLSRGDDVVAHGPVALTMERRSSSASSGWKCS